MRSSQKNTNSMSYPSVPGNIPVATLYIYDRNSPFTNLINNYMRAGKPVMPLRSVSELSAALNESSLSITPNISATLLEPLPPGEYVSMDQS